MTGWMTPEELADVDRANARFASQVPPERPKTGVVQEPQHCGACGGEHGIDEACWKIKKGKRQ